MAKASSFFMVSESFIGTLDGVELAFHKGEVIDADDPALKAWPAHFAPLVARTHGGGIEQATAAPGEKRGA